MTFQNPSVAFVNMSTAMTQNDVEAAQRACSDQVHFDFGPTWHTGCRMNYLLSTTKDWLIIFKDTTDTPGALGYHYIQPNGLPAAYVFAKTCIAYGTSPSSVASHELLEMLADPYIDNVTQITNSTFYAQEVCDPVEQSAYMRTVTLGDGTSVTVEVSDFVTPAWFSSNEPGPFDWLGRVGTRRTLEPGGSYIGKFVCGSGWTTINADGAEVQPDPDDPKSCTRPYDRRRKA
jgi:hypothetical protein